MATPIKAPSHRNFIIGLLLLVLALSACSPVLQSQTAGATPTKEPASLTTKGLASPPTKELASPPAEVRAGRARVIPVRVTAAERGLEAIIVSTDIAVGSNKLFVALLDHNGKTIQDARLHFRFLKLGPQEDDAEGTMILEADPSPVTVKRSFIHLHEDRLRHKHVVDDVGVYLARAEFDSPGDWVLEVTGALDDQPLATLTKTFVVQEQSRSLPIGSIAPHSIQKTLLDTRRITSLDTSWAPNLGMHFMTIAQAVTSGKPTVIVFASPGFCTSQICVTAKEPVDELFHKYWQRVNFVHIEPYDLKQAQDGEGLVFLPWIAREWGIETEPWVFLVDKNGKITAKYEAFLTAEELEAELLPLMAEQ